MQGNLNAGQVSVTAGRIAFMWPFCFPIHPASEERRNIFPLVFVSLWFFIKTTEKEIKKILFHIYISICFVFVVVFRYVTTWYSCQKY